MTMTVRFSCVVDDQPLFRAQAANWIATLLASGSARADEIVVHVVAGTDAGFRRGLDRQGIRWREVERFGEGDAAYCNKLMQLSSPELRAADCAVLCDTDLAFAGDVRPWLAADAIRAKVVDLPNPPLAVLRELRAAAGLAADPALVSTSFDGESTYATNCNGGFYAIPGRLLPALAEAWLRWARFALDRRDLLGAYGKHADQLGFCLAMLELDLPFAPLPVRLNFPTHLAPELLATAADEEPLVLHYHWQLDASGALLPVGVPCVDAAIATANEAIRAHRRRYLDNRTFWDYRYAHHATLGSGVGSRGDVLTYRRQILYPLVSRFRDREILDVGCGDLEVMGGAEATRYTGLDLSAAAIAIAAAKRPDWGFVHGEIETVAGRTFDLVLCACVLIHVPDRDRYLEIVRRLIDACRDTLVIEAYDAPPTFTSEITFYHEPISETLRRDGRVGDLEVLGSYRDTPIILARRRAAVPARAARWPRLLRSLLGPTQR
jgi:SAM-dependent methyltransferase